MWHEMKRQAELEQSTEVEKIPQQHLMDGGRTFDALADDNPFRSAVHGEGEEEGEGEEVRVEKHVDKLKHVIRSQAVEIASVRQVRQ